MKQRLAILDADILYDPLRETYGSYGQMFLDLLADWQDGWQMQVYSVINDEYPASMGEFDAVLITGSKFDSFADDDWIVKLRQYVRELFDAKKPMIGICFGHQLLAHALGGRAGRSDKGWGLGVMRYQVVGSAAFMDATGTVDLIVSHQDQVSDLPPGAVRLWGNDFCINAAFVIPGQVLAIQGHPEFTTNYAEALLSYRKDRLSVDAVNRAAQTLKQTHDGAIVARWMRRFLDSLKYNKDN